MRWRCSLLILNGPKQRAFPTTAVHGEVHTPFNKLLIPLANDWVVFSVTPHEFIAADERVVSFGTYAGTFRTTGRSMSAPFAHRWVVRGGKIVRFNMYTDTVKVLEAMGAASLANSYLP